MNVPDDRIKTIEASYISPYEDDCRERVFNEIARGIIAKLKEFNKVKIELMPAGYFMASCSLSIIVPPRVADSTRTIPPGT